MMKYSYQQIQISIHNRADDKKFKYVDIQLCCVCNHPQRVIDHLQNANKLRD